MEVSAQLKYLRMAPRKVRLVANLIREKSVEEAENILNFKIKRAGRPILKLLKQALANAKNNFQLKESNLFIEKITVSEGSKLKRWTARARGQSSEIQKKTSHVTIILKEIKGKEKPFEKRVEEKTAVLSPKKTERQNVRVKR